MSNVKEFPTFEAFVRATYSYKPFTSFFPFGFVRYPVFLSIFISLGIIGLSIFYFKSIYPDSTILGFEPNPENFEILKKNKLSATLFQTPKM